MLHMSMVSLSGMCHMLSQVMTARCVTSLVLVSTNAFVYFSEHEEEEQSLTHPSERVVHTVSSSVTLWDGTMANVARSYSRDEKITIPVKNTVDFEWIRSSGCFTTKK